MSLRDHIKSLFDAPSRRQQTDYSQDIPLDAITGVLLLYRDFINGTAYVSDRWMEETIRELGHLHHHFANANGRNDLSIIAGRYLETADKEGSITTAFLDFLEVSLRSQFAPNHDNDFVDGINETLQHYESPYLLSQYVRREYTEKNEYGGEFLCITFDAYPKAYLQQDTVVQREAIEPTLEVFADPAYSVPAQNFRKALGRHRSGDYDGCLTACAAAVEGAIKVVAKKNRWRIKGAGLDTVAQSFLSKSSLPDTLKSSFRPLSNSRNTESDAHGHASKVELPESAARHYVALAASLVVLVQSQEK